MTVGDNPFLSFEILETFREVNKQIRDRKDITSNSADINSKSGKYLKDKEENSKELADDSLETERNRNLGINLSDVLKWMNSIYFYYIERFFLTIFVYNKIITGDCDTYDYRS